jgi:hypothetical protein
VQGQGGPGVRGSSCTPLTALGCRGAEKRSCRPPPPGGSAAAGSDPPAVPVSPAHTSAGGSEPSSGHTVGAAALEAGTVSCVTTAPLSPMTSNSTGRPCAAAPPPLPPVFVVLLTPRPGKLAVSSRTLQDRSVQGWPAMLSRSRGQGLGWSGGAVAATAAAGKPRPLSVTSVLPLAGRADGRTALTASEETRSRGAAAARPLPGTDTDSGCGPEGSSTARSTHASYGAGKGRAQGGQAWCSFDRAVCMSAVALAEYIWTLCSRRCGRRDKGSIRVTHPGSGSRAYR